MTLTVLEWHLLGAIVFLLWRLIKKDNEVVEWQNKEREQRLSREGWTKGYHGHMWPPPPPRPTTLPPAPPPTYDHYRSKKTTTTKGKA